MNSHTALSVVLNEFNSELIDGINKRNMIEKIVDNIFDELCEFIEDLNFYNNSKKEIEVWRKLIQVKHNNRLKFFIVKYDELHKQFADLYRNILYDLDNPDDTTPLIQATNAIYLLKYKKQIIHDLTKNINKKRTTKCCGKILNEYSQSETKEHKHYSFYNMIQDRNNDLAENACKTCRPVWSRGELYNCEICNLKWKLYYRCFYQYICRSADVLADKKNNYYCFYNDYTSEQKKNAGLDTVSRSLTYLKSAYDVETDNSMNEEEIFNYYENEYNDDDELERAFDRQIEDVVDLESLNNK
tara:strand:- start:71 stop:970 length:900 start_codon:yes stop_codon:yes gene_type:complete